MAFIIFDSIAENASPSRLEIAESNDGTRAELECAHEKVRDKIPSSGSLENSSISIVCALRTFSRSNARVSVPLSS